MAPPHTLRTLTDADLIARLVSEARDTGAHTALAAEFTWRATGATSAASLRRLLEGYARAAPEYVDEETQATARVYLARLAAAAHHHRRVGGQGDQG